jgi:site-specific DNA-cytosine methylase
LSYITNLELRYVVVENVPGLEKKSSESGLDDFITDLEKMGISTNRAIFPRFVRWRVFGMWCRYFSRFTACSGREQQSI